MSSDVTDWRELREFTAVDLQQSFVIDWRAEEESLLVELDVLLLPEHALYEEPRPNEGACFRQAVIEFRYCTNVAERGKEGAAELADAIESLQTGRIAGLRRAGDGFYEIFGEFGTVGISAERPLLRLTEQFA